MANTYDEKAREVLAIPHVSELDWRKLGEQMRSDADDAHEGHTPHYTIAWDFMIENPECLAYDQWPSDMPQTAPLAWLDGYLFADKGAEGRGV